MISHKTKESSCLIVKEIQSVAASETPEELRETCELWALNQAGRLVWTSLYIWAPLQKLCGVLWCAQQFMQGDIVQGVVFHHFISAVSFIQGSCLICGGACRLLRKRNILSLVSALICHLVSARGAVPWTCDNSIWKPARSLAGPHYNSPVCHPVILEYHIIMQLSVFISRDSQLKTPFIASIASAAQTVS